MEYTTIYVYTGVNGATEIVKCNYPDLEETISDIKGNWENIKTVEISNVPIYRHPDFGYFVSKYVLNLIGKWKMEKDNEKIKKIIFGE